MRENLVGVVTHRARVSIDVVVARARQEVRELRFRASARSLGRSSIVDASRALTRNRRRKGES
jgi:hypothetical protein